MRSLFFIHIFLIISICCLGQEDAKNIKDTSKIFLNNISFIPGSFTLMDVDMLGNIYACTEDYQLKKFSSAGDLLTTWNDVKSYGNPTLLDVSNPMRIMIYYQPYATTVILDRLLTFRHAINFRKKNIFRVNAIATSYDNHIWLFDEQDFKLKKIDDDGSIISETTDWRILFSDVPTPKSIIENNGTVFLYDENMGLYSFDYYGSFKNKMPVTGIKFPGFNKNIMYGTSGTDLIIIDLSAGVSQKKALPAESKGYSFLKVINNKIYLIKEKGIYVYSLSTS